MKKNFNRSVALVLTILAPSIILRALAMDILLPCVPNIAQEFAVAFSTSQWVLSVYFIGAGIGQLVAGPLADEYGRRRVLIFSILLIVISSYACAIINNIYLLILLRFLQGLGACGTTVVCMAIIRDLYSDQKLPKIYSYFNSIIAVAPLLGPLVGAMLLNKTGSWRATFYFTTGFSVLAFAIVYFLVPETNPDLSIRKTFVDVPIFKSYRKLLSDRQFLSYCCFDVMGMSSLFMFFSMSAILLIKILGVDPHAFGYYFALCSAMYLLGNILSPSLQIKFGTNGTILLGSVHMLLGGITMLIAHGMLGLTVYGLIIPNIISTFGVGLLFGPSMAGVVKHYKHIAGIASATYGALFLGGSALLVAAIMQLKIVDTSVLGIGLCVMGAINIIVLRSLKRLDSRENLRLFCHPRKCVAFIGDLDPRSRRG